MDIVQDATHLLATLTAFLYVVERLLPLVWKPAHKRRIAIIKATKSQPKK